MKKYLWLALSMLVSLSLWAKTGRVVKVKYQSDYGYEVIQKKKVVFYTGQEVQSAFYYSGSIDLNALYMVIRYDEYGYKLLNPKLIKIEGKTCYLYEADKNCIDSFYENLQGIDLNDDTMYEICVSSYCNF